MALEVLSWFAVTLFLMFLALLAYLRVFRVSMKSRSEGETQAIITVRLLPPRESWSNLKSISYENCNPCLEENPTYYYYCGYFPNLKLPGIGFAIQFLSQLSQNMCFLACLSQFKLFLTFFKFLLPFSKMSLGNGFDKHRESIIIYLYHLVSL